MRVGIVGIALELQYAGIHTFLNNLIKTSFGLTDIDIFILLSGKIKTNSLVGLEKVHVEYARPFLGRAQFIFREVGRWAKRHDLHIVVEPAHFGPFSLPKSIKRVTVIHDLTPIIKSSWHPIASVLVHRLLMKRVLKQADLIITNSEYTKSDIIKYCPLIQGKIQAIHLGVSSRFQRISSRCKLAELGIHKNYILYLGTIEPRKNLKNLIMAYNKVRQSSPNTTLQLIIAGKDGWKTRDIVRERKSSSYIDDIILLGYVDREIMPSLLSHTSLFVYPSLYEGFGLPVLEALACGARVLTSDLTSLPEVGGEHCYYCDPNDTDDIAQKMMTSLQEVDSEEQCNRRMSYAQSFTWEKFGEFFYGYLKELYELA